MKSITLTIKKEKISLRTTKLSIQALSADSNDACVFAILRLPKTYHSDLPTVRFSHVCDLYLMLAYGTLQLCLQPYFRVSSILLILGSVYLVLQIIQCIVLLVQDLVRLMNTMLQGSDSLLLYTIVLL